MLFMIGIHGKFLTQVDQVLSKGNFQNLFVSFHDFRNVQIVDHNFRNRHCQSLMLCPGCPAFIAKGNNAGYHLKIICAEYDPSAAVFRSDLPAHIVEINIRIIGVDFP